MWDDHLVKQRDDGSALIYIDRQLLHEVTSPQAFEGLRLAGRKPWRIDANIATPDHNVPTTDRDRGVEGIVDPVSRIQVETLDKNCDEFGILEFKIKDQRQGIVHVIGPEQGATLPGMSIVCGDSHTSTHGAFGCLAHGIGTSEVEHVLATQCLVQQKMKNMLVKVNGKLGPGVTGKDVVLAIIGKIGTAGGTGHAIEFGGEAIQGKVRTLSPVINAQSRTGMVYVDVPGAYAKGLKPGMYLRGEFDLGQQTATVIPQTAVIERDGFTYAFTVDEASSKVQCIKLRVNKAQGEFIEVLEGVKPGDKVVKSGVAFLAHGDLVKVIQ